MSVGSGIPLGGPHSNKAVSPLATRVSLGWARKSSRKTVKKKNTHIHWNYYPLDIHIHLYHLKSYDNCSKNKNCFVKIRKKEIYLEYFQNNNSCLNFFRILLENEKHLYWIKKRTSKQFLYYMNIWKILALN